MILLMVHGLKDKISTFPDNPGVYLMKNKQKKIIYVGKAKSIRKRVRSYFSGEKDIKTRILVENIHDIEIIVTSTEQEAFLLENNLIKQWRPKFNINLKDGKSYPVIRLTKESFPRVFRTRRIIFDGSEYYGPYPSTNQVDLYLKVIEKHYPLRKCRDRDKPKKRETPCLYYHIHRCKAPCCGYITREEYGEDVARIKKLLSGKTKELTGELEKEMLEASKELNFERAAIFRDQISAITGISENQKVVDFKQEDRDYIGFFAEENFASFIIFQMRAGNLTGRERFRTEIYSPPDEAVAQFFIQYYGQIHFVPRYIYLPMEADRSSLEYFIERELKKKVNLVVPKKGNHAKLVKLATDNAREDMRERIVREKDRQVVEALKKALDLPRLPKRIEGFDISHLAGKNMIGAMVSFQYGRPDKSNYRYFKIKSLDPGQIDDFEAMREVIARRYTRVLNENLEPPDLILIDGGKGQLGAAHEILQSLGMEDQPVIGLAKKNEEVFKVGEKAPVIIERHNPALRLLQAVRDESHRFGITLNRKLSRKDLSRSIFENVKGIGEKKSRELIKTFGSADKLLQISAEEIALAIKVKREVAEELLRYLKQNTP
jgi:excinuclease ABC subunit C